MIRIDPLEEIRRLVEDEDVPEAEARARVKADLASRSTVRRRGPPKAPMNLSWTPQARRNAVRSSRGRAGRPRKP